MSFMLRTMFHGVGVSADIGLMAGGSGLTSADRFLMASDAVSTVTGLAASRGGGGGTGTATNGYISGGVSSTTDKYSYSGNTFSSGTSLIITTGSGAAGNATVGVFRASSNTNKYTYSSDTVAAGTALTYSAGLGGATASTTIAMFSGGYASGTHTEVSMYTFSDDSVAAGSALSTPRQEQGAVTYKTNNRAYLGGGWDGSADLSSVVSYSYVNGSQTAGSSLNNARYGMNAFSNATTGIFAGAETDMRVTDKYTFSGDVVSTSGNLSAQRQNPVGLSNAHGGL